MKPLDEKTKESVVIAIRLTVKDAERLKKRAHHDEVSVSEFVRRALDIL